MSINPADHISLAASLSLPYARRQQIPIEDTEQFADALLGLCVAAQRFDPARGYQFSTYASHCISGRQSDRHRRRSRGWVASQKSIGVRTACHDNGAIDRAEISSNAVDREEIIEHILAAIDNLPEDCRTVIQQRLTGLMLREISAIDGRSKQRIQQIEQQAYRLLRNALSDLA